MRALLFLALLPAAFADGLNVTEVRLHQYEDGPPLNETHRFTAGEAVYLSFRVAGFKMSETRNISLEYSVKATDHEGVLLAEPRSGKVETELALEDKDWMPKLRYDVVLPETPSTGAHRFEIAVQDKLAGTETKRTVELNVRPSAIPPSPILVVHGFGFLRNETDTAVLPPGSAFRPGDVLWARFDLAGYKFGEKNFYDVRYGVTLKDGTGKVLFSNPMAASASDKTYYPRRHVSAVFSLNLANDMKPGEYTLVLNVTDALGSQTASSEQRFRVE